MRRVVDVAVILVVGTVLALPVVAKTGWWWAWPGLLAAMLVGPFVFSGADHVASYLYWRWFEWRLTRKRSA